MKWLLILAVLIGATLASAQSSSSAVKQTVQAYSGTMWTTITFQLSSGNTHTVTQRTLINRDETGAWRAEVYRPTQGIQQNTSSPLDHVFTATTLFQTQSPAPAQSSGEILIDDVDLGTVNISGVPAMGRRRVFQSIGQQSGATHTLETWFSPTLGAIVHMESHNFSGTTIVSDLSNLQLGSPVSQ